MFVAGQEILGVAVINVTANDGLKLKSKSNKLAVALWVLNPNLFMLDIRASFAGKANVHWTENHETGMGDDRKTETRHYDSRVSTYLRYFLSVTFT